MGRCCRVLFLLCFAWATTNAYDMNTTEVSCDASVHLHHSKFPALSHIALLQTSWPPPTPNCTWNIVGDSYCDIDLSCKINIPSNPKQTECTDNFMRITDGSEGEMVLCGTVNIAGVRASGYLRDLFVDIQSNTTVDNSTCSTEMKGMGIFCTAQCALPNEPVKRLPSVLKRKLDNTCVCGKQAKPVKMEHAKDNDVDVERGRRIVGGVNATMNEFPWNVAFVFKGTRKPFCSGSLINSQLIITAAHCFLGNFSADNVDALLHAHVLDLLEINENGTIVDFGPDVNHTTSEKDSTEATQRFNILEIINHPLFSWLTLDFDVALVRIKEINLGDATTATPICLPKPDVWDSLMVTWTNETKFTSLGWGRNAEDSNVSMAVLQKLEDIPYIPFMLCADLIPEDKLFRLNKRVLCAGYLEGGKDTCQGDSGAGLSLKDVKSGQFMQFGVVSWGDGCARNDGAGVYTRLTEVMQWVHFVSGQLESSWCLEENGY